MITEGTSGQEPSEEAGGASTPGRYTPPGYQAPTYTPPTWTPPTWTPPTPTAPEEPAASDESPSEDTASAADQGAADLAAAAAALAAPQSAPAPPSAAAPPTAPTRPQARPTPPPRPPLKYPPASSNQYGRWRRNWRRLILAGVALALASFRLFVALHNLGGSHRSSNADVSTSTNASAGKNVRAGTTVRVTGGVGDDAYTAVPLTITVSHPHHAPGTPGTVVNTVSLRICATSDDVLTSSVLDDLTLDGPSGAYWIPREHVPTSLSGAVLPHQCTSGDLGFQVPAAGAHPDSVEYVDIVGNPNVTWGFS